MIGEKYEDFEASGTEGAYGSMKPSFSGDEVDTIADNSGLNTRRVQADLVR